MKTTREGRPYCVIRDPSLPASTLEFNPLLYDILKKVSEDRMACTIELHFNGGNLGNGHVRIDAEKLVKAREPGAILHPVENCT